METVRDRGTLAEVCGTLAEVCGPCWFCCSHFCLEFCFDIILKDRIGSLYCNQCCTIKRRCDGSIELLCCTERRGGTGQTHNSLIFFCKLWNMYLIDKKEGSYWLQRKSFLAGHLYFTEICWFIQLVYLSGELNKSLCPCLDIN